MKLAGFDTSFLNRVKQGKINFDHEFPKSQYIRSLQSLCIDEFFFDKDGNWYKRLQGVQFYKDHALQIQKPFHTLLHQEYVGNFTSLLESEQEKYVAFFEGVLPVQEQQEKEEAYRKIRDNIKEAKDPAWLSIPIYDKNEVIIDVSKITSLITSTIKNEDPFDIQLALWPKQVFVRVIGNKFFLWFPQNIALKEHHVKLLGLS